MPSPRTIANSDICSTFFDQPGYIASKWFCPLILASIAGGGVAPGANSIRLIPGYIRQKLTINTLGVRITTASAGGNVQAAIYANNAATVLPTGSPLASTASMSTTSTGSVNAAASVQLNTGLYWWAVNCDNATVAFTSTSTGSLWLSSLLGSLTQNSDLAGATAIDGLSVAQTFGTWPDLTSGSFTEVVSATMPIVQFRVGSVP